MNLRRIGAIVQKEVRQLRRDPRLLQLLLLAPLIQLILFGYAISTDLKGVRLGIVLEDPSPESQQLIRAIEVTGAFVVTEVSAQPEDVQDWLDRGAADITLHIPPDFSQSMARGETPVVQVISDGSDPNTATLAYQYLSQAALSWASQARVDYLTRHPLEAVRFARVPQVEVQPRFWYNPELKSVNFQIPGVLALITLALTLTPTTILVVKERELGTLEQISVTPIRGAELLIGKTIPVAIAGMAMTLLIAVVAQVWFQVPLRGSVPFLFACSALFQLSTLGLGLLLAMVARTQLQAQLLASFLTTPMIMLSGFLFPIANMPRWAQWITYTIPMRYYMDVVRGVFLKGQGLAELWPQALMIAGLGVVLYGAGIFSFRKRVD